MAVALEHIDCFATAHSLASLAALEGELALIGDETADFFLQESEFFLTLFAR